MESVELFNQLNEEYGIPLDNRFYEEYAPLDSTFSQQDVQDYISSREVQSITFRLLFFSENAQMQVDTFMDKVGELLLLTRAYKEELEWVEGQN